MRGRVLLAASLAALVLPAIALATSYPIHNQTPPAGKYKFYGLGPPGSGSLTVHGKTVSRITFTLPVGPSFHDTGCNVPVGPAEESTDLITVSGSFKLVRQEASVPHGYRYWVLGGVRQPHPANDVGVSPIHATFAIPGLPPVSGQLGIFFSNTGTGIETGALYADFDGCLALGGSFDHGYHG